MKQYGYPSTDRNPRIVLRNIKYKKKGVWEMIRAKMLALSSDFSARPERVEEKCKSLTTAFPPLTRS